MKAENNPYRPGAGMSPPELSGRDDLLESSRVAFARLRNDSPVKSIIMHGLRGVGKTVLLNKMFHQAEDKGVVSIHVEVQDEKASLLNLMAPAMTSALDTLSQKTGKRERVAGAIDFLRNSVKAVELKAQAVGSLRVEMHDKKVSASEDLDADLTELLRAVGEAADEQGTAFALFVDEIQNLPVNSLESLIAAIHRANQLSLPVILVAAGLPQILEKSGRAKSYAERLLDFEEVDNLSNDAAMAALVLPAQERDVEYEDGAISEILEMTDGYPYFLQEWGKHCWNAAPRSPISVEDVRRATVTAQAALDANFFRVRTARISNSERGYMRAMAALGPGPYKSREIAEKLGRDVSSVAPVRGRLIAKGMIYSPAYGATAFTVPLFDGFMRRVMPDFEGTD